MKLSQSSLTLLENAIRKATENYRNSCEQTIVTDFHLQANPNSGELIIYNDEDEELARTTLEEWAVYDGDNFNEEVERLLSTLLNEMKNKGAFEDVTVLKPYSFVLVDDEKETLAELLLMDDDTLLVNDELLKGLDEELDEFLKKLLE